MLQFALHHFQHYEKLTLIAFSCINVYLYPQDRISGPWSDGKWHCLQLAKDGSHCHCLEPDCWEGRHVLKPLLNIQLRPVSQGIICQWCLGGDTKETQGYACHLVLSCFLCACWWAWLGATVVCSSVVTLTSAVSPHCLFVWEKRVVRKITLLYITPLCVLKNEM